MGIKPLTSLEQFAAKMWPFRLLGGVTFLVFSGLVLWADLNSWIAILCGFLLIVGLSASLANRPGDKAPIVDAGRRRVKGVLEMPENGIDSLVVRSLREPLILVNGLGRVVFKNEAANVLVGQGAESKHLASVLRVPGVLQAVENVLGGGEPEMVEYTMPVPVERNYEAFIAPVDKNSVQDNGLDQDVAPRVLIMFRDVTETRRVEQMRVDFVANASHELKTPLAAVLGFIETLQGHAKDDPEAQSRFLEIMSTQAQRMQKLIEDLLSLSRIELREHVPPSDHVDMQALVGDVVDGLSHLAEQQDVSLSIDEEMGQVGAPTVTGDWDELYQVMQNLVDNAIKYGGAGKKVDIGLRPDTTGRRPMLEVTVKDYGPGIAREHLPRLTERFYRADVASSRERGGTGLGLAIVKHIISRHDGTLTVDSELGEGTNMTIRLPIKP
ncbi:MAG: hypothetical protein KUG61_07705 [Parvibaculaceae bacterium]|nr:hypothetical protein [Parvibaculaceae bacterium]